MSKSKKNLTTSIQLNDQANKNEGNSKSSEKVSNNLNLNSSKKKISTQQNSKNSSNTSLSQSLQMKRRVNKVNKDVFYQPENTPSYKSSEKDADIDLKLKTLPISYCVNINQDGSRNMDKVSHINDDNIECKFLESKLRPISGLRNHLKRNISTNEADLDIIKDTDIIQRIASFKTLKRLDLSHNRLQNYPRLLCDLGLLESLNLTGNDLQENDFPPEIDKYQNLFELILDSNNLKRIPKTVCKCKKITRLSMRNNNIIDLKNIENFKRLNCLILDHNNLTQLDENIKSLEKLEILHINNNQIANLEPNLFKLSLINLKQLDLSYNKIQSITTDILMLPNLELLNLSNNNLSRLPILPMTYFRTVPIFSLDLSSNQLVRFYDYLLQIARNIDLSSNKIKTIPSKAIQKLTNAQLNHKKLKLDENPIVDPPIEISNYDLKHLKDYFDEVSKKIQLNKGFKVVLLGDCNSGKTSLAFALEDFSSQSNLIEQSTVSSSANEEKETDKESKLVDIHEFFFHDEEEEESDKGSIMSFSTNDVRINSAMSTKSSKSDANKRLNSSLSFKVDRKTTKLEETNAFSNTNLSVIPPGTKKTCLPVSIYDFNGNIEQYGHLFDLFIDKSALFIICVDCTNYSFNEKQLSEGGFEKTDKFEDYLGSLLDLLFLKMSKNTSFYLLPVLTKIDKIPKSSQSYARLYEEDPNNPVKANQTQIITKLIAKKVENFIRNHLNSRLNDIKTELKKIEQLPHISASQSDRLKQLIQTQTNLNPEIYKKCLTVSSTKMEGVRLLTRSIKEIATSNKKYFPDINKKVPAFWTEVEKYACNVLGEMPTTKFINDRIRIVSSSNQASMSMLCVDYEEYKEKIVEKFGMSHLVEQITKYMNSNGKVLWYQETEKLRRKVFLRPSLLYDMFFVLFRCNFGENFSDNHTQALRSKLIQNTGNLSDFNQENVKKMQQDLLTKGVLHMDLLKLLWFPILITDSVQLLLEVVLLFMDYFYIGYPTLPKDKLKTLFQNSNENSILNKFKSSESGFSHLNMSSSKVLYTFNSIIVPFFLPKLQDEAELANTRYSLATMCSAAAAESVSLKIKKERPRLLARISKKYSFPWGLLSGIFEKFSVNLIINSDIYYKVHYKNFIYALSEENDVGLVNKNIILFMLDFSLNVYFLFLAF